MDKAVDEGVPAQHQHEDDDTSAEANTAFEKWWAQKESEGYQYGRGPLATVQFGFTSGYIIGLARGFNRRVDPVPASNQEDEEAVRKIMRRLRHTFTEPSAMLYDDMEKEIAADRAQVRRDTRREVWKEAIEIVKQMKWNTLAYDAIYRDALKNPNAFAWLGEHIISALEAAAAKEG